MLRRKGESRANDGSGNGDEDGPGWMTILYTKYARDVTNYEKNAVKMTCG